jgi:hypothetical protein
MKEQPSKDLIFIPQNFDSEKTKIVSLVNDAEPTPQNTPADVLGFKRKPVPQLIKACLFQKGCTAMLFQLRVNEEETHDILLAFDDIISKLETNNDGSPVCLQIFCDDDLRQEEIISETSLSHLYETIQTYAAISSSIDEETDENIDKEYVEKLVKNIKRRLQ